MLRLFFLTFVFGIASLVYARQWHVSVKGDDNAPGTLRQSFHTISRAAAEARPGDAVLVHEGVYREWVQPPRGGSSGKQRITYMAAPGEKAVNKGSEMIKEWKKFKGQVWRVAMTGTGSSAAPENRITTASREESKIPRLFLAPGGSPLQIDRDYFGNVRSDNHPVPGPFEKISGGKNTLKVW